VVQRQYEMICGDLWRHGAWAGLLVKAMAEAGEEHRSIAQSPSLCSEEERSVICTVMTERSASYECGVPWLLSGVLMVWTLK
jgi:hypothetical protein